MLPHPVAQQCAGVEASAGALAGATMEQIMPKSRLELLREIAHHAVVQRITLEEHGRCREILVDNLTARAVLRVHNAPEHDRSGFMELPWDEMIRITRERLPLAS